MNSVNLQDMSHNVDHRVALNPFMPSEVGGKNEFSVITQSLIM